MSTTSVSVGKGHVIIERNGIQPPVQHPLNQEVIFEATYPCVVEFSNVSVFNRRFVDLEPGRPVTLPVYISVGSTAFWPIDRAEGLQIMALGITSNPVEYMRAVGSPGNILVP